MFVFLNILSNIFSFLLRLPKFIFHSLRFIFYIFQFMYTVFLMYRYNCVFVFQALGWRYVPQLKFLINKKYRSAPQGQCLRDFLIIMGPFFIKLGQVLAVRQDILGKDFSKDLSDLQDNLPPIAYPLIQKEIEKVYGKPIEDLFVSFEERAHATASIAQVHKAKLKDTNEIVAIKILRPKIAALFAKNIGYLKHISYILRLVFQNFHRLKFDETICLLEKTIENELDLRYEGASADRLRKNFHKDPLIIPKIFWNYVRPNVLVSQWIDGVSIDEINFIENHGLDPVAIVHQASTFFFHMVFRDGFFHGDMHPGNLLIDQKGQLIVLDFGIMGYLSLEDRLFLGKVLHGFLIRDYDFVARAYFEAGYLLNTNEMFDFSQACCFVGEPMLSKPLQEISIARLFKNILDLAEKFNLENQPKFLLLQRSMFSSEGISRSIAPHMNMWEIGGKNIEKWMFEHFNPYERLRKEQKNMVHSFQKCIKFVDHAAETLKLLDKKLHEKEKSDGVKFLHILGVTFFIIAIIVISVISLGYFVWDTLVFYFDIFIKGVIHYYDALLHLRK